MNRYSLSRILLFLEAFILLGLARALLLCVPFRHTARWFGLRLLSNAPQEQHTADLDAGNLDTDDLDSVFDNALPQPVGAEQEVPEPELPEPELPELEVQIPAVETQVGWAVRAASRRTPWASKCLVQALAGSVMLRRRRIGGIVYLGLYRPDKAANSMLAHAWLRTNNAILTGRAGHEKYTVVARFRLLSTSVPNFTTTGDGEKNRA